jgi:hypothetical protein
VELIPRWWRLEQDAVMFFGLPEGVFGGSVGRLTDRLRIMLKIASSTLPAVCLFVGAEGCSVYTMSI